MPRAEATILHADLDAFFASVEQRDDPRLRGRPMVVGRGVVLAASYEARAFGIHGAMGGGQARSLCPWVIAVDPRMDAYADASRAVFDVFARTAPIVEGISIDEAFLDVGGLERVAGEPVEIARRLRHQVRDEVGLPITIGVASSKFLAKVASAVAKPDGLLHVPAGEELVFLHPLPVERLWGVGPVTARKLHDRGINTVGEVAGLPEAALVSSLGPAAGRHIHALANARDPRRVESGRRRRSMGSQRALGRRARPESELAAILDALCDRVTGRLRKGERLARTIVLRLRFDDFARATRSHTLPRPTSHTQTVRTAARSLLATAMPLIRERGLTLIGIALSNLDDADAIQLSLPFDRHTLAGLDAALDELRERFGSSAVMRAAGLGRELAPAMPVLPD